MSHESLFEPGLVDRLRGQYEHVDVHAIAGQVRDMARRKGVRNPNGLLVHWVHLAASQQAIADEQLTPDQVATRLEAARSDGFTRLNPFVVDALRSLGNHWPTEAPAC